MSDQQSITSDTWLRYQTVRTLIGYLRRHPEMVGKIRFQHHEAPDRRCASDREPWPCLLRCVAEEAAPSVPEPRRRSE